MRKSIIAIFLIFAACVLFEGISSNALAANTCLTCHSSADKLKAMIKDEDFNKSSGEGYG